MMTNSMTCEVFADRLMAYLEDDTDATTRAALERHAVTCAECGAILADLRKLRVEAANLPELTPSRDLWAGIAERIEAPVVSIGGTHPVESRRSPRSRFWKAGLLAASLAGATTLGYLAGNRGVEEQAVAGLDREATVQQVITTPVEVASNPATGSPVVRANASSAEPTPVASAPVAPPAVVPYGAQLVVAALTADYDKEIRQLNQLLDTRRNQLDPVTVAVIERNLQVIDAAITEARQAIARDPGSRFLIESLNQSLQMKVELMRTAAMLPSRT